MSARKPVSDWANDFDLLDPEWTQNPYPIWDELRNKCPIAHTERFNGVSFPARYEDIRAIAYDTEHFSSRQIIVRDGNPPLVVSPPLTSDPPAHSGYKRVLLPAFTPAAIEGYAPQTRAICRELLERIGDKRHGDGATDYVQEIPVRVIASMLGVSEREGDRFRRWIHEFVGLGVADPSVMTRALNEMNGFFSNEIRKRRIHPDTT